MSQYPASKSEQFLGWPGTKEFLKIAAVYATAHIIYSIFYNGSGTLKEFTPWRFQLYLSIELEIPYWQSWGIIYGSIPLLMALGPFVFRKWQEIIPLCLTIIFEAAIAALFFVFLPLEAGFSSEKTGLSALVFEYAHQNYLDGNYFPSFHVVFAVTNTMAYLKRATNKFTRVFLIVWCIAICVSTVLYHTHHIIDVIGGVLLAVLAMRFVYQWAEKNVVPTLYENGLSLPRLFDQTIQRESK